MDIYNYLPSEIKEKLIDFNEDLLNARESELERSLNEAIRDIAFLIKVNLWEYYYKAKEIGIKDPISLGDLANNLIPVNRLKYWIKTSDVFVAYLLKPPIGYNEELKILLKRYGLRVYEEILEKPAVKRDSLGNEVADVALLKLKSEVLKQIENRLMGRPSIKQEITANVNQKQVNYNINNQVGQNNDTKVIKDIEDIDKKILNIIKEVEYKEVDEDN